MNQHQYGFKIIGEMTTEEMVEELIGMQREQMEKMNIDQLKSLVVDYRASLYRQRLVKEAGFTEMTDGGPY